MSQIPGLTLRVVHEDEQGVEIMGYRGPFTVPCSHKVGNLKQFSDFKTQVIYEGTFSSLLKAEDKTNGGIVMLRKYTAATHHGDDITTLILKETQALKMLKHDNIISFYGFAAGRKVDSNYLIMDYCPFSLKDLIDMRVEDIYKAHVIKSLMQQLFLGLAYVHSSHAIHRNITNQNIMFTEKGVLKICDFSTVCFYSQNSWKSLIIEMRYRAPELLLNSKDYGAAVDIWAAGCVFAELLVQKPIFEGCLDLEVLTSICNTLGTPTEELWPGFGKLWFAKFERRRLISTLQNCDLKETLGACPHLIYEVIESIFLYCPKVRSSAEQLLEFDYFKTVPLACSSQEFASILQGITRIKKEKLDANLEED